MKKRTLSLMLALLMIISVLPVSAAADAPKSGTCGENLTWTLSDDGVLTISGSGAMADFDYGAPWESYKSSIKSAVVGDGVTNISMGAFSECGSLASISIPSSVTSIAPFAFLGCIALESISIPDSVTSIGRGAFQTCPSLKHIDMPSNISAINESTFYECSSLTSISIPNSVTSIGASAFVSCSALKSIVIPDSVMSIGASAFASCSALSEVKMSENLRELNRDAFSSCTSLKSIDIPIGVKYIDNSVFFGCTALESISLPDSIVAIYTEAFRDCTSLRDIYFAGTKEQWNAIKVGEDNDALKTANIHFAVDYPFTDVDTTGKHMPFADAILWAANEGITTGYGNGIFKPDADCTRAQVVTFLWRAAGEPAPKSTDNPFADVSAKQANGKDNPYYTAILWAVGEGITLGVDKTHFAPDATVTRAQFVTFLWRYENKPAAKPGVTLKDLGTVTNADFKSAILWAAGEGITTGYGDGSFRPNAVCTRAHVVTFIYRDMAE